VLRPAARVASPKRVDAYASAIRLASSVTSPARQIRQQLLEQGVIIENTKGGVRWKGNEHPHQGGSCGDRKKSGRLHSGDHAGLHRRGDIYDDMEQLEGSRR